MKYSSLQLRTDRFSDRKGGHSSRPAVRIELGTTIMGDSIMKRIKLTKGQFALVDDADFEWLNQWKWTASKMKNGWYAFRDSNSTSMHRQIMGLKKYDGKQVDHRNGSGLDNRRENLRLCTHSENAQNIHNIKRGLSSKYQGVSRVKKNGRWQAQIKKDYKPMHLGEHETAKAAARTYDKKALELFGPNANTNFPKENYDGQAV